MIDTLVPIRTVADFNREARAQYNRAVAEWKPETGGFPFLGFYIFRDEETGEEYEHGFVVSSENGRRHYFGKTKNEAMKKYSYDHRAA